MKPSVDQFIEALFQVIQPFATMFSDILDFFAVAGEREGQVQWRISIENEIVELSAFEEFLARWRDVKCSVEVPALDWSSAWIPLRCLTDDTNFRNLHDNHDEFCRTTTGFPDVDTWIEEYNSGRYTEFPASLYYDSLVPGLDDAVSVIIAALSILKSLRITTRESIHSHWERCRHIESSYDGFHICSILQNETDHWLRCCIQIVAHILTLEERDQVALGDGLRQSYGRFPRRRIGANVQIEDLERLLSLPAWKKRHEMYAVWVAAEMMLSLYDHDVKIFHNRGELRFSFTESKIALVKSARPTVSLISERRTPLDHPVGRGRKAAIQPDFGLWTRRLGSEQCDLVVEVKHYKRRAKKTFRDTIIDYATGHDGAKVLLVNYGPVGEQFNDLPRVIESRCAMIGDLHPQNGAALEVFRREIRCCVGPPFLQIEYESMHVSPEIIVIDVSSSMADILHGEWLEGYLRDAGETISRMFLVDITVRDEVTSGGLEEWLAENSLYPQTSLRDPLLRILRNYPSVLVITDREGFECFEGIDAKVEYCIKQGDPEVTILRVSGLR